MLGVRESLAVGFLGIEVIKKQRGVGCIANDMLAFDGKSRVERVPHQYHLVDYRSERRIASAQIFEVGDTSVEKVRACFHCCIERQLARSERHGNGLPIAARKQT